MGVFPPILSRMSSPASFSDLLTASLRRSRELWKPALLGGLFFWVLGIVCTLLAVIPSIIGNLPSIPVFVQMAAVAVSFFFQVCIRGIIPYAASLYFLLLAVRREMSVKKNLREVYKLLVPYFGVLLWIMLLSYSWIAAIGIPFIIAGAAFHLSGLTVLGGCLLIVGGVCAFIRGPRFSFGAVVFIVKGKGIRASVEESRARTEGYWGKIVGNGLLFGLTFAACAAIVILVVLALGLLLVSILGKTAAVILGLLAAFLLGVILVPIVGWAVQCVTSCFHFLLFDTIAKHPRRTK